MTRVYVGNNTYQYIFVDKAIVLTEDETRDLSETIVEELKVEVMELKGRVKELEDALGCVATVAKNIL